ncbi:hypothetical protein L484_018585 [Morus notabilis]|uniref:Uncharacterized protein n=1 Tax=Morus notabilis TaxID=981085 RepID=W9RHK3_9ROSA|nr:hypothetical protein L484_018585 [Morus notabilis]
MDGDASSLFLRLPGLHEVTTMSEDGGQGRLGGVGAATSCNKVGEGGECNESGSCGVGWACQ